MRQKPILFFILPLGTEKGKRQSTLCGQGRRGGGGDCWNWVVQGTWKEEGHLKYTFAIDQIYAKEDTEKRLKKNNK